ncbi:MAG TPA: hypothetical protein VF331_05820 [Polyangiales bacterium]
MRLYGHCAKDGPIAHPDQFLPWLGSYANVAYAFHPYQHGARCGEIGAGGSDLGASDPYESGFCSFYKDGTQWDSASGAALPGGKSCTNRGARSALSGHRAAAGHVALSRRTSADAGGRRRCVDPKRLPRPTE